MASYFSQVPDFEYVSRLPGAKISDYIPVKNLFKKGKSKASQQNPKIGILRKSFLMKNFKIGNLLL